MSLRFITGLFTSSAYGVTYTYVLELLTERRRMLLGVINSITFGIGTMYLSLLAYLFNDWRSLARAIAITPGTSYIIYFAWVELYILRGLKPTITIFPNRHIRPSSFVLDRPLSRESKVEAIYFGQIFYRPTLNHFLKIDHFYKICFSDSSDNFILHLG